MTEIDARLQLTYEDYWQFPSDDGLRHELVGGVHVVTPSPDLYHQQLSRRIQFLLYRQIEEVGRGEVFNAPTDVKLSDEDGLVPDLVVVLSDGPAKLTRREIVGPPDLVVEILSRSTRRNDLGLKKSRYEQAGVPEYWVVDPVRHVVVQFVLEAGEYRIAGEHAESIAFRSLADVTVDLSAVW